MKQKNKNIKRDAVGMSVIWVFIVEVFYTPVFLFNINGVRRIYFYSGIPVKSYKSYKVEDKFSGCELVGSLCYLCNYSNYFNKFVPYYT